MGSMEKAFAAITLDMSRKMTDLSTQMAAVIEKTSERSSGSAREVLDQAGSLAARSAEQLATLLERHSTEMSKVDDLRDALDSTLRQFTSAIGRYNETTEGLEKLTTEVNKNVSSLAAITKTVAEGQEMAVRLLSSSSGQIDSLKGFAREQEVVWQRIEASMTGYETMFQNVEAMQKNSFPRLPAPRRLFECNGKALQPAHDHSRQLISQPRAVFQVPLTISEKLDELHSAVNKWRMLRKI